jgi:hypothetical protein
MVAGLRGIVLGDAGFDLTHQVGTNVCALGEDTAAQTGENGDEAAAEPEGNQRHDVMGKHVVTGNGGQRQARNDHTGDGTAPEGHGQTGGHTVFGGFGGPDVGQNGYAHADVAGQKGSDGADGKTNGGLDTHGAENHCKNDDAGDPHGLHLTVQVGDGAFLDGAGDRLHLLVARRRTFYNHCHDQGIPNSQNTYQRTSQRNVIDNCVHSLLHSKTLKLSGLLTVEPIHGRICALTDDGNRCIPGCLDDPAQCRSFIVMKRS